jgi:hypothetical protein
MVLFFIADLALTLAFKLSTWCLGKTYNGIVYLVTYKSQTPKPNAHEVMSDGGDCTDDCTDDFVTMTRHEYDALKHSHDLHHHRHHASSEDELVSKDSSSSECASSK